GSGIEPTTKHRCSSPHTSCPSLLIQSQEPRFHLSEEPRRDEAVAEDTWPTRQRRQAAVRPFIDIVLRDDYPARRIIQAERLTSPRRNLHANCILIGLRARDR